eukprot:775328-Amphidinium_carterae.1
MGRGAAIPASANRSTCLIKNFSPRHATEHELLLVAKQLQVHDCAICLGHVKSSSVTITVVNKDKLLLSTCFNNKSVIKKYEQVLTITNNYSKCLRSLNILHMINFCNGKHVLVSTLTFPQIMTNKTSWHVLRNSISQGKQHFQNNFQSKPPERTYSISRTRPTQRSASAKERIAPQQSYNVERINSYISKSNPRS